MQGKQMFDDWHLDPLLPMVMHCHYKRDNEQYAPSWYAVSKRFNFLLNECDAKNNTDR